VFGRWIIPDWNSMSTKKKVEFKRLCLVPFLAYGIYIVLSNYGLAILLLFAIYYTYKKFEKK